MLRRILPVVKKDRRDKIVGMLENILLKIYSHKLFKGELIGVQIKYLMTPIGRLYTPMPESSLDEFISNFWEPIDGLIRVSSFAIY